MKDANLNIVLIGLNHWELILDLSDRSYIDSFQ